MKRYRCGCRVASPAELSGPRAKPVEEDGWFMQENTADGKHYVQPCSKHTPGVITRWGMGAVMGVVRGQA